MKEIENTEENEKNRQVSAQTDRQTERQADTHSSFVPLSLSRPGSSPASMLSTTTMLSPITVVYPHLPTQLVLELQTTERVLANTPPTWGYTGVYVERKE